MAQLNFLDLKAQFGGTLWHLLQLLKPSISVETCPVPGCRFLEWTLQDWMALIWMMRHTRRQSLESPTKTPDDLGDLGMFRMVPG